MYQNLVPKSSEQTRIFCLANTQFRSTYLIEFKAFVFLKMGHSRPIFSLFLSFNTVDSKRSIDFLPMTGFEPRTSGVGNDQMSHNHCPKALVWFEFWRTKRCQRRRHELRNFVKFLIWRQSIFRNYHFYKSHAALDVAKI